MIVIYLWNWLGCGAIDFADVLAPTWAMECNDCVWFVPPVGWEC